MLCRIKRTLRAVWLLTLLAFSVRPELAGALDPTLERAVAAYRVAAQNAQNYTYREQDVDLNLDGRGNVKSRSTDTYEIVFLEGAPFKRHVAHDEKTLSDKERKEEQKQEADAAETRRKQSQTGKVSNGKFIFTFPLDKLGSDFAVTPAGNETVDGKAQLLFRAVPLTSDPNTLKEAARNGTAYDMKIWVDIQDPFVTRVEAKVLADGPRYKKDSLIVQQWTKLNDEAWLPAKFHFTGTVRYMMTDNRIDDEETFSDYRRFQANSTLVP